MTIDNNSNSSHSPEQVSEDKLQLDDFNGASENGLTPEGLVTQQALAVINSLQSQQSTNALKQSHSNVEIRSNKLVVVQRRAFLLSLVAVGLIFIGFASNIWIIGAIGTVATLALSLAILFPWLREVFAEWFSPQERAVLFGILVLTIGIIGAIKFTGVGDDILRWGKTVNWDASGALGEWFGALGQISIAIIAVYVAWRQYVISKDLTIQQNLLTVQQNIITQQQTIDSYFQGISDLVLNEEGLLEDWPQERAIAEGRTAAILSSVDGSGKAKILRFLSRSRLLTPLKRDRTLGRPILDGSGGYAEDRTFGQRVIDLGVTLAGADLSSTDLRWTDLSEANLVRANLSGCDLVKANLSRAILYEASLRNSDLKTTRLFYGSHETASPRSRVNPPNFQTGEYTGAVVQDADFTNVQRMSEQVRYYCCAWGGEKTRGTIPGGCEGIPNKLEK
ncbi:Pentapeptide repeat [Rivularia sp. IAM M-261]|nr:Pentapeptide repeat [Calothrix sp. PCC 7716]GJD23524.1 Pentapeptide repeat [Rivularia sp. IAM M-261]